MSGDKAAPTQQELKRAYEFMHAWLISVNPKFKDHTLKPRLTRNKLAQLLAEYASSVADPAPAAPTEYEDNSLMYTEVMMEAPGERCPPGPDFCSPKCEEKGKSVVGGREESPSEIGDPLWPLYQEYTSMVPPKGTPMMTYSGWLHKLAARLIANETHQLPNCWSRRRKRDDGHDYD
jgi:hypothetical protein